MLRTLATQRIATVENPIKSLWSNYHKKLFILGRNVFYKFDIDTNELEPFQSVQDYEFVDFDVSEGGELIVSIKNQTNSFGEIKVFSSNLFNIINRFQFNFSFEIIRFTKENNIVSSSKKDGSIFLFDYKLEETYKTSFRLAPLNILVNKKTNLILIIGENKNEEAFVYFCPDKTTKFEDFFDGRHDAIIQDGGIVGDPLKSDEMLISSESSDERDFKLEIIMIFNLGKGVSSSEMNIKISEEVDCDQDKIRVFVGSSPWTSDKWDSGEVETFKTEILYGGGENLTPGQKYWVHIAIHSPEFGWSSPQIQEFIMPNF